MKIQREALEPIEFDGLVIRDYTAERDGSSSVAEITVPAGARHRRAWSRRSDKYYYVVDGGLTFVVDGQPEVLSTGDVCVIPRGVRFSYENDSGATARLLLVHTPSFELADEVFEEE